MGGGSALAAYHELGIGRLREQEIDRSFSHAIGEHIEIRGKYDHIDRVHHEEDPKKDPHLGAVPLAYIVGEIEEHLEADDLGAIPKDICQYAGGEIGPEFKIGRKARPEKGPIE
jgi:hypothetical protein